VRIVRIIDQNNQTCFAVKHSNGALTRVMGDILGGFNDSGEPLTAKKLLAPIEPAAIIGIGLNYHDFAEFVGASIPEYTIVFMKNPATLIGPEDAISIPSVCMNPPQADYEAELAVIIGKKAKNVSEENALDYVLGYTVTNDVTARNWLGLDGAKQWVRGKSFDTFTVLGPEIVTKDEISDPQNLPVQSRLNGKLMQNSNTSKMIFSVKQLIAYLSQGTTLLPGTVILTGTPLGVGVNQDPKVFLMPGDKIEVSIEGIGSLLNNVVAGA
jgi:2-keto-4-pentenoate hydratase/2-oxohepta-3-ene-1,7-dioic acid hydratase in catechol pathway